MPGAEFAPAAPSEKTSTCSFISSGNRAIRYTMIMPNRFMIYWVANGYARTKTDRMICAKLLKNIQYSMKISASGRRGVGILLIISGKFKLTSKHQPTGLIKAVLQIRGLVRRFARPVGEDVKSVADRMANVPCKAVNKQFEDIDRDNFHYTAIGDITGWLLPQRSFEKYTYQYAPEG